MLTERNFDALNSAIHYHELSSKQQTTPSRQQCFWQRTDNVHRRTVEHSE